MRIPGNKVFHLSDFFYQQLISLYERNEIESIVRAAFHHYLGYSASDLISKRAENLNQSDVIKLYDCAKALSTGKPLQYILGEVEFYGTKLLVNPSVLIPRPETEELVDIVVKENKDSCSYLDIGTGSGCIPVALKKRFPSANVMACDISNDALRTASLNAERNATLIYFFRHDVLGDSGLPLTEKVDVIISNPPYIAQTEKHTILPGVLDHEPHLALFAKGNDPVIFYRKIIDICSEHLSSGGLLYFELNPITAEEVEQYARQSAIFGFTELIKDMSGNTRFFKGIKTTG